MIKQQTVGKSKLCDIHGCDNKAIYSRKVRLLEQIDDYEIAMNLCSHHKNHFKQGEALLGLDLKAFGKEALLGESKDKDKQRIVNETLEYMRKQAKSNNREESVEILINAAKHFTKVADGKFLFGFYFGELFELSSFRDLLGTDVTRQRKAEQIRNRMSLKEPYAKREHPDFRNEMVDICRCGHEWFMHGSGEPRGECFACVCPRYGFEQKLTRAEAMDLQSLMSRELQKS